MKKIILILIIGLFIAMPVFSETNNEVDHESALPISDELYEDQHLDNIGEIISNRIQKVPFNLAATLIFLLAIIHTMATGFIAKKAHHLDEEYEILKEKNKVDKNSKSIPAGILHLFGEVEVVFGIWTIVLAVAITYYFDWFTFTTYIENLHYKEPLFVIVIMVIASSRPILKFFEMLMQKIVKLQGESLEAWWLTILIFGPLLGSFITEPAAMTISAYLLSEKIFKVGPTPKIKYATVALLFVNISIGGALTNFAAPPILMVADAWGWSSFYLLGNFGIKAFIAIIISTTTYYFWIKKDFNSMKEAYENYLFKKYIQHEFISQSELESSFDILSKLVSTNTKFFSEMDSYSGILKNRIKDIAKGKLWQFEDNSKTVEEAIDEKFDAIKIKEYQRIIPGLLDKSMKPSYHDPDWDHREDKVPTWMVFVHMAFLVWTIVNAHHTVLVLGGFLFYLGFFQATIFYQNRLDLKQALLVAFFLSGLIIHGTLQAWWISPILGNLKEIPLNFTAIGITAFNDNAALTYLATLVPNFSETLKYAVVSGAITGGGLTIIANAPNPIGVAILKKYFKKGISPIHLVLYALIPTAITTVIFHLLK